MTFNKYDTLSNLDDSGEDWVIRVRAHTIWKSINGKTKEFKGYNLILFDDSVCFSFDKTIAINCFKLSKCLCILIDKSLYSLERTNPWFHTSSDRNKGRTKRRRNLHYTKL